MNYFVMHLSITKGGHEISTSTEQFNVYRKLLSPPHCRQCSPVVPAAQQRYYTSGTRLLLLGQGPTAAQEVTAGAEVVAERCYWLGPLTEPAPKARKGKLNVVYLQEMLEQTAHSQSSPYKIELNLPCSGLQPPDSVAAAALSLYLEAVQE